MSYLGSSATPIPVAFSGVRTQSLSGTGLVSLFTLSRQVNAVTDIEVVVNNVQQSPFDGSYSIVNNGLGLQFSENVNAGTNNIYVIYRDQPMGSLIDPGAVRLTGDQGIAGVKTFAGNTGFGTTSPLDVVHVAKAGGTGNGGRVRIQNSGVRQWSIGTIDANFTIKDETGGTEPFKIDAAGRLTVPNQPSFRAAVNGSPTATHGAIILWDLLSHNTGNHYSAATGRFTAPVAGRYFVSHGIRFNNNGSAYTQSTLAINGVNAPNGLYANATVTGATYSTPQWSGVLNLNAGDYLTVSGAFSGGTGVYSGGESWFSGHLIG
jgi:hypothetical protein